MMKALELLKTYPNATNIIREWYLAQMLESFNDNILPEEFKENMLQIGVTDENLAIYIDAQPRALFDVFDENKIYIEIQLNSGSTVLFMFLINRNKTSFEQFSTRKEAEMVAIETAFKLLEDTFVQLPELQEEEKKD